MNQTPAHREIEPLLAPSASREMRQQRNLLLVKSAKTASDLLRKDGRKEEYNNFDVEMDSRHLSMKSSFLEDAGDTLIDPSFSTIQKPSDSIGDTFLNQIPAIIVATVLGVILGIPFAAAYFPLDFFPLEGETAFGLRLFIFSTFICQVVLTFTSQFTNPIGLQIVENVPFYHAIARICVEELGYGIQALSNLMLILTFTTILVGVSFYFLGTFQLGRIIYFIPKHVLVGLIGKKRKSLSNLISLSKSSCAYNEFY